jgi:hypothetical protein
MNARECIADLSETGGLDHRSDAEIDMILLDVLSRVRRTSIKPPLLNGCECSPEWNLLREVARHSIELGREEVSRKRDLDRIYIADMEDSLRQISSLLGLPSPPNMDALIDRCRSIGSNDPRQFDYLLNAFEQASQSNNPSMYGYRDKRAKLLQYVRTLEGKSDPIGRRS